MAFFDLFRQKTRYSAEEIAKGITAGINEYLAEINARLSEQGERLRKIETKQKETGLQLEEIDGFLQNSGNETSLLDALISLADIIYDFYYFAGTDPLSPLFEQARMMWNTTKNAAQSAGLVIIDSGNEPFDFRLHSVESTEHDDCLPEGYVTKTLKCGYIYKDEITRRALVIINKKTGTMDNFQEEDN
jgi:molecular chaperone GrpE (heat shock protein)